MRWHLTMAAALVLAAGCFPIELNVSGDGRVLITRPEGFFALDTSTGKAVRLYRPKSGTPAFARFSPDGKSILAVVGGQKIQEKRFKDKGYVFSVVRLSDGQARPIFATDGALHARFSPDGTRFSVTRMPGEPELAGLPELLVVNVKDGSARLLAKKVSARHCWLKRDVLMAFQVTGQGGPGGVYTGNLVAIGALSGRSRSLVSAAGTDKDFLDDSPDGRKVLFTARAAGPPGKAVKPADVSRLYEFDSTKGTLRPLERGVRFAIRSPDGKRVLLGVWSAGAGAGSVALRVADAGLQNIRDLATAAVDTIGSDSVPIYPAWVGNDRVAYLARKVTYGHKGRGLALTIINVDDKTRTDHQLALDTAAAGE